MKFFMPAPVGFEPTTYDGVKDRCLKPLGEGAIIVSCTPKLAWLLATKNTLR